MGFCFCFWVCCVVLFVCVHVSASASLLHLVFLGIMFFVVFLLLALFCQLFFLFVSSFLRPCRCLASLALSCMPTGFGPPMEGFFGDGGWGGGGGGAKLNARRALCVSPPLAGWGMRACFGSRRTKAAEISRQAQQHRGWRKLAQEGKSIADFPGSRDLVACTAQRRAQIRSRRKKNCRFPWQAAEISCQAQHRGWRKVAQEGKKCRFRGKPSKEAKDR